MLRSPPPLLEMDMVRMMKMKNRKAELVHLKRKTSSTNFIITSIEETEITHYVVKNIIYGSMCCY